MEKLAINQTYVMFLGIEILFQNKNNINKNNHKNNRNKKQYLNKLFERRKKKERRRKKEKEEINNTTHPIFFLWFQKKDNFFLFLSCYCSRISKLHSLAVFFLFTLSFIFSTQGKRKKEKRKEKKKKKRRKKKRRKKYEELDCIIGDWNGTMEWGEGFLSI